MLRSPAVFVGDLKPPYFLIFIPSPALLGKKKKHEKTIKHAIIGGGVEAAAGDDTGAAFAPSSSSTTPPIIDDSSSSNLEEEEGAGAGGGDQESPAAKSSPTSSDVASGTDAHGWRDEKDRLLDRLFAWKTGEAWREVVLVCGAAAEGRSGRGGLRSACELEVRGTNHTHTTQHNTTDTHSDFESQGLRRHGWLTA